MPARSRNGRFVKSRRAPARRRSLARRTYAVARRGGRGAGGWIRRNTRTPLLGGTAKDQIGTKVVAGELVVAAAMEPFVADGTTPEGSIVDSIAQAIQNKDANAAANAVKGYPGAVRTTILVQVGEVTGAGVVRLIGRILGV